MMWYRGGWAVDVVRQTGIVLLSVLELEHGRTTRAHNFCTIDALTPTSAAVEIRSGG